MSFTYTAHETKGIRLNANECSRRPHDAIMNTFQEFLCQSELNRYPDDEALELRQAFASLYGLQAHQVIVGNGSDATLQLMITTFCRDGKNLLMLSPDFGMYRFYAGCMQSNTVCFETEWDGSFDLDAFATAAKENNAGLVLLSNPNNPTGHQVDADKLLALAHDLDPIVLAVDEAYMNFSDQSLLGCVDEADNLIVTATLSKAWGAAGIRCGFLAANTKLIEKMMPYKIVYSVSTLDQLAARAVLAHPQIMQDYLDLVAKESDRVQNALADLEAFETGQFHANFFQIRPRNEDILSMEAIEQAFYKEGIAVRDYPDHARLRITIGLPEENERILSILTCLNEQAISRQAENNLEKGDDVHA